MCCRRPILPAFETSLSSTLVSDFGWTDRRSSASSRISIRLFIRCLIRLFYRLSIRLFIRLPIRKEEEDTDDINETPTGHRRDTDWTPTGHRRAPVPGPHTLGDSPFHCVHIISPPDLFGKWHALQVNLNEECLQTQSAEHLRFMKADCGRSAHKKHPRPNPQRRPKAKPRVSTGGVEMGPALNRGSK